MCPLNRSPCKQTVRLYLLLRQVERVAFEVPSYPFDDENVIGDGPIGKASHFQFVDELPSKWLHGTTPSR